MRSYGDSSKIRNYIMRCKLAWKLSHTRWTPELVPRPSGQGDTETQLPLGSLPHEEGAAGLGWEDTLRQVGLKTRDPFL